MVNSRHSNWCDGKISGVPHGVLFRHSTPEMIGIIIHKEGRPHKGVARIHVGNLL